jgi:putative addiction module antidote
MQAPVLGLALGSPQPASHHASRFHEFQVVSEDFVHARLPALAHRFERFQYLGIQSDGGGGFAWFLLRSEVTKQRRDLTETLLCSTISSNKGGAIMRATVTKIGNSTGVILPKEVAARLKVQKGDSVFLTETPDGYAITAYDPEFESQMEAARRGMTKYRNALHELAKG